MYKSSSEFEERKKIDKSRKTYRAKRDILKKIDKVLHGKKSFNYIYKLDDKEFVKNVLVYELSCSKYIEEDIYDFYFCSTNKKTGKIETMRLPKNYEDSATIVADVVVNNFAMYDDERTRKVLYHLPKEVQDYFEDNVLLSEWSNDYLKTLDPAKIGMDKYKQSFYKVLKNIECGNRDCKNPVLVLRKDVPFYKDYVNEMKEYWSKTFSTLEEHEKQLNEEQSEKDERSILEIVKDEIEEEERFQGNHKSVDEDLSM